MKHLDETECFRDHFYYLNRTSLYPTHKEKSLLNGLPSSYITDSLMLNDPSWSPRSLDISFTKLFISIKILYIFDKSNCVFFHQSHNWQKRKKKNLFCVWRVHESLKSCWFMSDFWCLYVTYIKPASHASEFEITD